MSLSTDTVINKKKIRWSVSLFFFIQGLIFASWASRIPYIKELLQLSEGQLGTILLMLPLGQILTMTLSGRLVTKYSSRVIIPLASIGYGIILCSIAFVQSPIELGACLMLFGVLSNLGNIAVNTQGVAVENLYQKSIMSSFHGAWSLAGFCGALIGLATINLQLTIPIHFAFILALTILNAVISKKNLIADPPSQVKSKGVIKPDALIIQLGIICFLCMATEGAMFDWSGVYFKEIVKAPEKWVVVGYTAFMIMMATGRFIGDSAIRKFGKQRTLQCSGLLMSAGLILSVAFPTFWVCTIAFMMVGMGVAAVVPTVYSVTGQHPSIPAGQALALVSSISFFGFLLGPPLIGYIAEWLNLSYSYGVFSTFGIILFVLVSTLNVFKSK